MTQRPRVPADKWIRSVKPSDADAALSNGAAVYYQTMALYASLPVIDWAASDSFSDAFFAMIRNDISEVSFKFEREARTLSDGSSLPLLRVHVDYTKGGVRKDYKMTSSGGFVGTPSPEWYASSGDSAARMLNSIWESYEKEAAGTEVSGIDSEALEVAPRCDAFKTIAPRCNDAFLTAFDCTVPGLRHTAIEVTLYGDNGEFVVRVDWELDRGKVLDARKGHTKFIWAGVPFSAPDDQWWAKFGQYAAIAISAQPTLSSRKMDGWCNGPKTFNTPSVPTARDGWLSLDANFAPSRTPFVEGFEGASGSAVRQVLLNEMRYVIRSGDYTIAVDFYYTVGGFPTEKQTANFVWKDRPADAILVSDDWQRRAGHQIASLLLSDMACFNNYVNTVEVVTDEMWNGSATAFIVRRINGLDPSMANSAPKPHTGLQQDHCLNYIVDKSEAMLQCGPPAIDPHVSGESCSYGEYAARTPESSEDKQPIDIMDLIRQTSGG